MAIYRQGQASMDAQGYVTGYDTKWREQLTLIRPGATIFFLTQPLQAAVITEVISDTSIRAITTGGAVVQKTNYLILLHDSLTVDGLAQDVAETLRYYQSKETEIAEAIEFFKDFDLDGLKDLVNQVKESAQQVATDRAATEQLKNDTQQIKDSAVAETNQIKADTNAIKEQTQQIKDSAITEVNSARDQGVLAVNQTKDQAVSEMNQIKGDVSNLKNEAISARDSAQQYMTGAQSANNAAETAKNGAVTARNEAEEFAKSINADNLLTKSGNLAGLSDLPTSRTHIGLGDADTVAHQSLHLKQNGTKYGGGLESHRNDAGGALLTKSTLSNELIDGQSVTTIATENLVSSKTAYLQYSDGGLLSGPNEVRAKYAIKVQGVASPCISLTNDAIDSSSMRHNAKLELNNDGILRLYRRANDGIGPYQRIDFPQIEGVENAETSLALKGGLIWNGNDVWLGNFDDITQGWSYVAGNPVNGPIPSNTYGSCFSYCSQGLKEGSLPGSYNPKDVWWRQFYYTTTNATYSRVNTNKGGWQPWSEYTMSAVSDERLKDVLGGLNVEGALDNINRMDFKLFRFKEERDPNKAPTVRRGVISQQLRGIDKEYTKLIGGYYHLDRTPMLLDGLAAIKALRARDVENKERISKLEKEVAELKELLSKLINNPTTLN